MKKLLFCLCLCISLGGYAQQKYEREHRIPITEVPQQALDFIEAFDVKKKVKWYQEQGLNSTSIEAKFKILGSKYSIEFSNTGILEDIEQTVSFKTLENDTQKAIQSYLKQNYNAFAIEKVQHQYTGDTKTLIAWRHASEFPNVITKGITHIYELVVRTRTNNKVLLFEFQFDEKGQKIAQKEIITRDTDILRF